MVATSTVNCDFEDVCFQICEDVALVCGFTGVVDARVGTCFVRMGFAYPVF